MYILTHIYAYICIYMYVCIPLTTLLFDSRYGVVIVPELYSSDCDVYTPDNPDGSFANVLKKKKKKRRGFALEMGVGVGGGWGCVGGAEGYVGDGERRERGRGGGHVEGYEDMYCMYKGGWVRG